MKDKYLNIIETKIELYRIETKKYEDVMLADATNTEAFINYYIAVNTLEKLLELRLLTMKS